jgi:hypothetical protein
MKTKTLLIIGLAVFVVILLVYTIVRYIGTQTTQRGPIPITPQEQFDNTPALSEEAMEQMRESHRLNAPDVYLRNQTPVTQPTFIFDSYVNREQGQYVFTVQPKITSLQQVQEDVRVWLNSIGITNEQIESLTIEYKQ